MKYAILGGSFNPVHIGHLFLSDAVLSSFGYDRIILVPAFFSPFKGNAEGASPRDRLEMLAASIPGDPRLTIDDCELKREGVSFTIDTIKDIIARYEPEGKPGLIIGDDLASDFNKWRRPEEIAGLADIIIAKRLSGSAQNKHEMNGESFPYPHKTLDNEVINIASQQIREKISRGEAWRYLVPSGARIIIEERGLYGFNGIFERETGEGDYRLNHDLNAIVSIENEVRSKLPFGKYMHSRNTALLAWDLCRRFGLDSQKGYLAGIAHDMCKPLDQREQMRLAHEDGKGISKFEQRKPALLHARAAAVLIQKRYGINNKDIIEAIKYHTTGIKDMNPLAKIVYIADKIEISRSGIDPALRKLSQNGDLETIFEAVLSNTISYLKSRDLDISYGTRRMLAAMRKRNKL
jgi:nicotinate-nucleotide adenylyltransferase